MPFIETTWQAEKTDGMTLLDIESWCAEARAAGFDDDTVPWVAVKTTRLLRAITALRSDSHPAAPDDPAETDQPNQPPV